MAIGRSSAEREEARAADQTARFTKVGVSGGGQTHWRLVHSLPAHGRRGGRGCALLSGFSSAAASRWGAPTSPILFRPPPRSPPWSIGTWSPKIWTASPRWRDQ